MPPSCNIEEDLLKPEYVEAYPGLGRTPKGMFCDVLSPRLTWISAAFETNVSNLYDNHLTRY